MLMSFVQKIGFMRIDGKNSSIERQESVRKFTDDPKCLVAVLSILAANMGKCVIFCCNTLD